MLIRGKGRRAAAAALSVFLANFFVLGGPLHAQSLVPGQDERTVAAIFELGCLRFTGEPASLRVWATDHHLPVVPADMAVHFLGTLRHGEVFGASTPSGKHVLISADKGACEVIGMADDPKLVQAALLTTLTKAGATISLAAQRLMPDASSAQNEFLVALKSRRWIVSITSKPHADAAALQPELDLLATAG